MGREQRLDFLMDCITYRVAAKKIIGDFVEMLEVFVTKFLELICIKTLLCDLNVLIELFFERSV